MTKSTIQSTSRYRNLPNGTRPHRRTIHAARQRARPHQRQGAGVASAAVARQQGRNGIFPRSLEGVCRDGLCRPAGAGELWRQRARLRRGRRGDGGDRPHVDAVAVPLDRGAGRVRAVARRQRGTKVATSAEDFRRLTAGGLRGRRGRQTSPAADQTAGGALRQWLQAQWRESLRGRRPHRRSLDRGGAFRRRRRRAQRADAVPGRSQGQGRRDRAHGDGGLPQCGAYRIR